MRELSSHREVRLLCQLPQTGTREQVKVKIWKEKKNEQKKSGKVAKNELLHHQASTCTRQRCKERIKACNERAKQKKQDQWQVICGPFKHTNTKTKMQIQIQIQCHQDKEAAPVTGDLCFVQTSRFLCLKTTPIKRVAFTLLFKSVIVTVKER